jgi:hypothetical protein
MCNTRLLVELLAAACNSIALERLARTGGGSHQKLLGIITVSPLKTVIDMLQGSRTRAPYILAVCLSGQQILNSAGLPMVRALTQRLGHHMHQPHRSTA